MSCHKNRCIQGPIGPQGPQGPQGPVKEITFGGLEEPINIPPQEAFKLEEFFIPNINNPNFQIISLDYKFEGDLVDLEKIRITANSPNSNNEWEFNYFFSQPTTTTIKLYLSSAFYELPSQSLNSSKNNYVNIETSNGATYKLFFRKI